MRRAWSCGVLVLGLLTSPVVMAQTGVDDDRVSLPEGPGSLEGVGENVEIDPNMGSMRYSIDVKTPEGRQGLKPDLGLSYSSSGGAGVLGVGWSMEMPSMERMTSRRTPLYQTDDFFAFDGGDELVLVDDSGSDYVYRDRFESNFKRYTWVNAGSATNQDYWIVEYSDGSKGYFGADMSGAVVAASRSLNGDGAAFRYHLVDRIDEYGNRIHYNYDNFDENKPLLTEVSWVFTGGVPLYRATINYEARADEISDAGGGFEEILAYRVSGIRIFTEDEISREYELTYQPEAMSGGFSRLARVTEYGLGGKAGGFKNPIEFSFDYQRALGVECQGADCDQPYIVNMGMLPGGSAFDSGFATLVDINGDALPDIVNTASGAHQFFINRLDPDGQGGFSQQFLTGYDSAVGTSGAFRLDGDKTQTLDVNGDGYSDLVNLATGKFLLKDPDADDWKAMGSDLNVGPVASTSPATRRFIDYNNDKRIDVLVSSGAQTIVYENTGDGFVANSSVTQIGVGFDSDLQLSDINGDGNSDVVQITSTGTLRYRVNLGWGNFSDWRPLSGATLTPLEVDGADLEDLNGDGRDDIVVVTGGQVKYWLNRGDTFDAPITITSALIPNLPNRTDGTQVLYSDMNANGSEDIVWIRSGEDVQFLELFPQRPNLMSDVDNGIGFKQKITYTTAARQEALLRGTPQEWTQSLQTSMAIVQRSDIYVTLTGTSDGMGLHDVVDYVYENGFYDGIEKQFRGFARVEERRVGNAFQEAQTTISEFDLGDVDVYRNGLKLLEQAMSGGEPIKREISVYEDCALAEVPSASDLVALGRFPVRYVCQTEETSIFQERQPESAWKTVTTRNEYDGYGNITKIIQEGVVGVEGDELTTETTYALPTNIWSLNIPVEQLIYDEASGDTKKKTYYYDGPDFVGLPKGEVQVGFLSREEVVINNEGDTLQATRQRRDEYGNIIESIDPNGSIEQTTTHRRLSTYDAHNLFLSVVEVLLEDEQGPYSVRRESRFDLKWQRPNYLSSWVVMRNGQALTPENATSVVYDRLGRLLQKIRPNDDTDKASEEYTYELGDPFSSVTVSYRSTLNGPIDEQTKLCFDGKGRSYQSRTRLANNDWLVTGFSIYNDRGAEVELFQPYASSSEECEQTKPTGVRSVKTTYDGLFRPVTKSQPDAEIYGGSESLTRYEYRPLEEIVYDFEDTVEGGPHEGTPLTRITDGIGRVVELQRLLKDDDGQMTIGSYKLHYDNTGSFTGYTDPAGTRHELSVDLADRVTQITNPNLGTISFEYDDAGNIIRREDARGMVLQATYDGGNRLIERWNAEDREGTLSTWSYDFAGDCDPTQCTQLANRLASVSYPLRDAEGGVTQGARTFGYDARGRKIFKGMAWGQLVLNSTTAYDNRDRVSAMTFPGGKVVESSYDAAGRVTSIEDFVDEVRYTQESMLAGMTYANGATFETTFDELLRPRTVVNKDGGGNVLESFEFTRDRMGSMLTVSDTSGRTDVPSADASYEYDAWYRLKRAEVNMQGGADALDYVYTLNDNITSIVSSLGAESVAHVGQLDYDSSRPNAVARAGGVDYGYSAAGHMTQRGDAEMTWDYLDRMTGYVTAQGSYHYMYGEDERIVAELKPDGFTLYGPDLFELRDGIATTYAKYKTQRVGRHESSALQAQIYPDVAPLSDASTSAPDQQINAADAWALLAYGDELTVVTPAEQFAKPERVLGAAAARMLLDAERSATTSLQFDHMSNITIATNEGGEVRGQRGFYPTGMLRWSQGHIDPYGYTGQEHMESGMVRFQYRFLDPRVGRWASFDPAFLTVSIENMDQLGEATTGYAYVANNFMNSVDPLGLNRPRSSSVGSAPKSTTSSKPPSRPPPAPPSGGSTQSSSSGSSASGGSTGSGGDASSASGGSTTPSEREKFDASQKNESKSRGLEREKLEQGSKDAALDRSSTATIADKDREAATSTADADRSVAKQAIKSTERTALYTGITQGVIGLVNGTAAVISSIVNAEASKDAATTAAEGAKDAVRINKGTLD